MPTENRQQRGGRLIEQMMGLELADETRETWKRICPDFEQYVTEFVAGDIWSRPQLDLKPAV